MSDRAFIASAKERWAATLALAEKKDENLGMIAIALWATMNVDRLIEVAERNCRQPLSQGSSNVIR